MICKICGEDINEKGQTNVSPISGYPVCEDCKDVVMCERCCEGFGLYYVEEWDAILCCRCILEEAERRELIYTATHYYTQEYEEICSDSDYQPVIDHLKEFLNVTEVDDDL